MILFIYFVSNFFTKFILFLEILKTIYSFFKKLYTLFQKLIYFVSNFFKKLYTLFPEIFKNLFILFRTFSKNYTPFPEIFKNLFISQVSMLVFDEVGRQLLSVKSSFDVVFPGRPRLQRNFLSPFGRVKVMDGVEFLIVKCC